MESMAIVFALVALITLCCCLIVPIAIGVYVSKDTKKRGMSSVLWVLVSVFAPGYIGFIIYLVMRNKDTVATKCPCCGSRITEKYKVCPNCLLPLKNTCPNCDFEIEEGWTVCPNCSQPLSAENFVVAPTQGKKTNKGEIDKGLITVIVLMIVVPIIAGLIVGISSFFLTDDIFDAVDGDYYEEITYIYKDSIESQSVKQWIKDCDKKGDGIYLLKAADDSDGFSDCRYVLYANSAVYDVKIKEVYDGYHLLGYATIHFELSESDGKKLKKNTDYTLVGFEECYYPDDYVLQETVSVNGTEQSVECQTDFNYKELESFYDFDAQFLNIDIETPASSDAAQIAVSFYRGKNEVCTKIVTVQSTLFGMDDYSEDDTLSLYNYIGYGHKKIIPDSFSYTVYDKNDRVLYESEKVMTKNNDCFTFSLEEKNGVLSEASREFDYSDYDDDLDVYDEEDFQNDFDFDLPILVKET